MRMAHARPAYENVSLHGDVFSQVSLAFAQSFLPTGGALSAHWQMPFCCALALCAVRTHEKHVRGLRMPGLAYKNDSLLGDITQVTLPIGSAFCLLSLLLSAFCLCYLLPSVCVVFCLLTSCVTLSSSLHGDVFVKINYPSTLCLLPSAFLLGPIRLCSPCSTCLSFQD